MKIVTKYPNGPTLIEPNIYKDDRGYFFESFNDQEFKEKVADVTFVQDNESKSSYGVLRGMHFQTGDFTQAKLVRVIKGEVVDVVIDCRPESENYTMVYCELLSEENHRQFFVPRGFAHGFLTLRDNTIFQYKCDNFYNKESEGGFAWDCFNFRWNHFINLDNIILSEKDKDRLKFDDINFENLFKYGK